MCPGIVSQLRDHPELDVYRLNGRVQIYLSRDPTVLMTLLEDVVAFHPATGEILSDISSAKWNWGERLAFSSVFHSFWGFRRHIC